jgi:diguanylate cyclase (GGDEF)-like protein
MTVFRDADHLLRWGGEEFLVVARDTDRNRVAELAERLRGVVSESPFVLDDGVRLPKTCSIGVAAFPFSATDARAASWEDVVELADLALYAAKKSGRDAWVSVAAGPHFGVAKDAIRAPASSLAKAALALNVSGDIAKVSAVFGQ